MGWRSWNAFGNRITQDMMIQAADAVAAKNRTLNGKAGLSLCDVGYCAVGIDEGWEDCGAGVNGTQHDAKGNPVIEPQFPDMGGLVQHIHSLGLKAGWYENGCKCGEKTEVLINYEGDVKLLHDFGFDGVKLDGCGKQRNLTLYAQLMQATGKEYLIENCHWGDCTDSDDSSCPTATWCPFNWYRTSGDINSGPSSWFNNLQTTRKFQDLAAPLSQPGCWAYPDMLEVGRVQPPIKNSTVDTTYSWNRAHFGAWCIVSSPLILGLELTDQQLEPVLDVIGNSEAIAINQAWAGHPGYLLKEYQMAPNASSASEFAWGEECSGADPSQTGWKYDTDTHTITDNQGRCLSVDSQYGASAVALTTCTSRGHEMVPDQGQQWQLDPETREIRQGSNCLDLFAGQTCSGVAPRPDLYACNGGSNQKWTFNQNGTLQDGCGTCLGVNSKPPPGASTKSASVAQLWVKPQPNGAKAVLLINSSPEPASGLSVSLAELGITGAAVSVRDVWNHKDLGRTTAAQLDFPTIGIYDSGFFMLTA